MVVPFMHHENAHEGQQEEQQQQQEESPLVARPSCRLSVQLVRGHAHPIRAEHARPRCFQSHRQRLVSSDSFLLEEEEHFEECQQGRVSAAG